MMCVLRSSFSGTSTDILQGRRQPNPPKPVGYERALMTAQEARQRLDSEQKSQVKPGFNTARPSLARFVSPGMRAESTALTPTLQRDSSTAKEARIKPAVPLINPYNRFLDDNKGVGSYSLPLSNTSTKPEEKSVCWKGINSSISSSPGFHIWAERLAMLTGETKSRAASSQIPPMKQEKRKTHTTRASIVAVPHFLEPHPTRT